MKTILTTVTALILGVASAQTHAQAHTTNNMSRYQRTTCAHLHGTINKNAKGNLVCLQPSARAAQTNHLSRAQARTTNHMSRYQRTTCAHLHGTIVKNAKGNLVCHK